jgi:hypothetical protein
MWTQIVGKIRMDLTPAVNHWWHVPLYIGARGLTTGVIPYGARAFEMAFDFIDHALIIQTSDAQKSRIELVSQPVAEFYKRVMRTMDELGLPCRIWRMPVEVPAPIPFDEDTVHATYDREYVERFWRALLSLRAVRCISSGGASTLRSRAFRARRLRYGTELIRSPGKPTHTK